jgi:hypothetical protein
MTENKLMRGSTKVIDHWLVNAVLLEVNDKPNATCYSDDYEVTDDIVAVAWNAWREAPIGGNTFYTVITAALTAMRAKAKGEVLAPTQEGE